MNNDMTIAMLETMMKNHVAAVQALLGQLKIDIKILLIENAPLRSDAEWEKRIAPIFKWISTPEKIQNYLKEYEE